ncbi:MAG: hypothetical protein KME42_08545 [Tildeniella nuda ZEHNDER 1965/U140]|jgi:hypothetical protein|nr:hypothetical protein [Tildeniella nuda ZEHNDER 1965/U140]
MVQSSPSWSTIVVGGGGILGALLTVVTLVTKGIVDKKEVQIGYLTQRNSKLETEIQEERQKSQRLVTDFSERLRNIDAGRLSPEDAVHLREIFNLIKGFENLQQGFSDCKRAAEWLDIRSKAWVQQACEYATQKYSGLLPRGKVKPFKDDLTLYLTWVHTCLSKHGHTDNTPLSDFVKAPVIASPHPYMAAISHLLDKEDWGELTPDQIAYLREVLIRLRERIGESFGN